MLYQDGVVVARHRGPEFKSLLRLRLPSETIHHVSLSQQKQQEVCSALKSCKVETTLDSSQIKLASVKGL